jgi:cytochrome c
MRHVQQRGKIGEVGMVRQAFRAMIYVALASSSWVGAPAASLAEETLRGHGGPVRALAVAADGRIAISGSFDSTAILWALERGEAMAVLRIHDSAVNAALALDRGRFVTAGQDGRIAIWAEGTTEPGHVFGPGGDGHDAPVAGLARSTDGLTFASAGWDRSVRLWAADPPRLIATFEGHEDSATGVAFLTGGGRIASVGQDGTLRIWPLGGASAPPRILRFPTPLSTVAALHDGGIAVGTGDGRVLLVGPEGTVRAEIQAQPTPVIALAVSPDGATIAAAGLRGAVALVDTGTARVTRRIDGPGLPVWSVAFSADGREVFTGGADRLVRRWNAATGGHVGPILTRRGAGEAQDDHGEPRGAEIFRACVACHTLTLDDGNRAGPTLHGVLGRRIGTAPGYNYSSALRGMEIVWSTETISRLFEIGPNAYTPGTKMPEQTIGDAEDRAALMRFLDKATRQR